MNFQPLVSIIIPVYNGSNFVKEAIDSALNQTYKNIEIIVVNDGSCDDGATEQIVLSYGDKIRYIHKENGGVSSALNVGIKNMRGEYFSWLSHDDLYTPYKVEKEVEALNEYGVSDAVVCCLADQVDKNSNCIQKAKKNKHLKVGVNKWYEALNVMLRYGSYNGCALLIPKIAFEKAGFFDEELRYCQDAKMWALIFLSRFDLIYIEECCCSNRIHGGQLTQTGRELFHSDSEKIAEILAPLIADTNEHAKALMFSYAYHNAVLDNKGVVKKCYEASKKDKLIGFFKKIKIFFAGIYGKIRPFIRKIYYRLFKKVKTK